MAQDVEKIIDKFLTKQEGEELIAELEHLLVKNRLPRPKFSPSPVAAKILAKAGTIGFGDFLEELRRLFYARIEVKLEVAFKPRSEFLAEVKNWFQDNLGKKVLLDLTIDRSLVAGARVTCNEHYKDYSAEARIS